MSASSSAHVAHVLVVEDDAQYRLLITRMLEGAGFKVTAVEGFAGAIGVIESPQHIDLLLVDIGMPAGTPHGLSIGKMAELRRGSLKILYMSGSDVSKLAPSLGEPILQKPFAAADLIAAVEAALS